MLSTGSSSVGSPRLNATLHAGSSRMNVESIPLVTRTTTTINNRINNLARPTQPSPTPTPRPAPASNDWPHYSPLDDDLSPSLPFSTIDTTPSLSGPTAHSASGWKHALLLLLEQPTSSSAAFVLHVLLTSLILLSAV